MRNHPIPREGKGSPVSAPLAPSSLLRWALFFGQSKKVGGFSEGREPRLLGFFRGIASPPAADEKVMVKANDSEGRCKRGHSVSTSWDDLWFCREPFYSLLFLSIYVHHLL